MLGEGFEAPGTDRDFFRVSVFSDVRGAEIRRPRSLGPPLGVANVVSAHRLFVADVTDLGHRE